MVVKKSPETSAATIWCVLYVRCARIPSTSYALVLFSSMLRWLRVAQENYTTQNDDTRIAILVNILRVRDRFQARIAGDKRYIHRLTI